MWEAMKALPYSSDPATSQSASACIGTCCASSLFSQERCPGRREWVVTPAGRRAGDSDTGLESNLKLLCRGGAAWGASAVVKTHGRACLVSQQRFPVSST